jgi:hypothetical protein
VSISKVNIETEPTLQPEISAGLQAAVNRLSEAIAAARLPGRPLSIASTITREAPLCLLRSCSDIGRTPTLGRWPSHGAS